MIMTIMPSSVSSVVSLIPESIAALISGRRTSECYILRPSVDIFVSHIFIYLCVEDILCLRRACKTFFFMTHEPIIWKRFLERLPVPHAPLRPTFRYSNNKTDYEIEQLVIRSITLDENWRSTPTQILEIKEFNVAMQICSLKFLPGGKYLVASTKDGKGHRHCVSLYDADNPRGIVAMARFPTQTKAYDIDAKYMKFQGQWGIMISYIERRFYKSPGNLHPSDFDTEYDLDTPVPFIYTSATYFISLAAVESITDASKLPSVHDFPKEGPFKEVSICEYNEKIQHPNLFTYQGYPFVALSKHNELVVQQLMENVRQQEFTFLELEPLVEYQSCPHRITAFRVLPMRPLMYLVTRAVDIAGVCDDDMTKRELHVVEVYIPDSYGGLEPKKITSSSWGFMPSSKKVLKVKISEVSHYFTEDVDHPDVARAPRCGPQPISIYLETAEPYGILNFAVWPLELPIPGSNKTYFSVDLTTTTRQSFCNTEPNIAHAVPGMNRAITYVVSQDDRRASNPSVLKLRRYICPETRPFDYPIWEADPNLAPVSRQPRKGIPHKIYSTLKLSSRCQRKLRELGLADLAWDESSGRLCFAFAGPYEPGIDLVEFSHFLRADIEPRFPIPL